MQGSKPIANWSKCIEVYTKLSRRGREPVANLVKCTKVYVTFATIASFPFSHYSSMSVVCLGRHRNQNSDNQRLDYIRRTWSFRKNKILQLGTRIDTEGEGLPAVVSLMGSVVVHSSQKLLPVVVCRLWNQNNGARVVTETPKTWNLLAEFLLVVV